MSRRRQKAWEQMLDKHAWLGGLRDEDFWRAVALDIGLAVEDFEHPAASYGFDGAVEIDVDEITAAARDLFFDREHGRSSLLVMVTLRCQRCDRRHDTMRVRSKGWISTPGSRGSDGRTWRLDQPRVTSERWASEIGDSTAELFRRFEGRSVSFDCTCGRRDIQFSMRKIRETLEHLTPDKPEWGRDARGEAVTKWPSARHATIRG